MDASAQFPCAQCGADLRFEPGRETLTCEYCGHANAIETGRAAEIVELDFRAALRDAIAEERVETTQVARCDNCGAQVQFDPNEHAADCPFCASALVTGTGPHRHFKPAGVLPFALTEGEARIALGTWLGSRWFAPSGIEKFARADSEIDGIYAPYWTFDAETQSRYEGQRGTVYYVERWVTVMTDKGPRRQRQRIPKVRWTPVRGAVRRFFNDVLVTGSRALPKRFLDRLQPWDLAALEPYRPDYLAGFRAEAYTVDLQEGYAEARALMDMTIRRDIRFDIGGDQQRIHRVDTQTRAETFKHILLPIWIAAYRYRGETYRFVVNGRTGQVQGERPYSTLKIALAVAAAVIVTALVFLVLHMTGALDQIASGAQGGGLRIQVGPGGF